MSIGKIMDFTLTSNPQEEDFRRRLGAFLDRELSDEIRQQNPLDKGLGPEGRIFMRKLGTAGWLGTGWPEHYGGSGGTLAHEIILSQEFARREAYIPNSVARLMAGPVVLRHGSEEMKREFLPRIARGEIEFSLGYTEPSAGSDLAAMRMRAVRDGDHFVLNGQKIFSTQSHYADYHWLAARTDKTAPRSKAVSLFIVDQRAPGITIHPIETLGGERTNAVFYDDVRVPEGRLVGEMSRGFQYMMEALEHERLMLCQTVRLRGFMDRLIKYARETLRDGRPLSEHPAVRRRLAKIEIEFEATQCLETRALWLLRENAELATEGTIMKLVSSELRQRLAYTALDILGQWGRLESESKWAPLAGEAAHYSRASVIETIGGGTSEVLRNVIAQRNLRLPRNT